VSFLGPFMGKDPDTSAFRDSNILNLWREALTQAGLDPDMFDFIADKIYAQRSNCKALLSEPMTPQERIDNAIDQMVRVPVEWGLGKMATNWKSIIYADGQKIQVRDVKRDVIIAALLTNALTILNCGQNIQFFTPAL